MTATGAQARSAGPVPDPVPGFGALPGQTLIILGRKIEVRPRRAVFQTQGVVEGRVCFEATITGMWV